MLRTTRWFPAATMLDFDQMFGRLSRMMMMRPHGGRGSGPGEWMPEMDGSMENGHYVMRLALPGVEAKDVEVTIMDGLLTVKGERKMREDVKRDEYFAQEIVYGAFERSFELPAGVDENKINAKWSDGMLEIKVPAPKAVAPKKVKILEGDSAPRAVKAA